MSLVLVLLVVSCSKGKAPSAALVYPDVAAEPFSSATAYDKDHGTTASFAAPQRFHVVPMPPNATIMESIYQVRMISNSGESLEIYINGKDTRKPSMFEQASQGNVGKNLRNEAGADEWVLVRTAFPESPAKDLTRARAGDPERNLWASCLWEKGATVVSIDYHGFSSPNYIKHELERIGNSITIKRK